MHIALARFPAVPAEQDADFRAWFAWSNDELRDTAGLRARHLLQAPDGSYTALVDYPTAARCCGGGDGAASHEDAPQARVSGGCCRS